MNDLDYFRDLRPDDTITDADLHSIRTKVFGDTNPDASSVDKADTIPSPIHINSRRRPHFPRVAVAAAAALLFVGGGVWVLNQRRDSPPDSVSEAIDSTDTSLDQPAATGPKATVSTQSPATLPDSTLPGSTEPSPPVAPSGPYAVPLVGIGEPGWTVTLADVSQFDSRDQGQVVFLSDARFDGAWLQLTSDVSNGQSLDAFLPGTAGDEIIDHGGVQVAIVPIEGGVIATWLPSPERYAQVVGWDMNTDQALALIDDAMIDAEGNARLDTLPAGASEATSEEYAGLSSHGTYVLTHADGRSVEVNLYPGGPLGLYQRQGATAEFAIDGRRPIMIGDETATIIDYNVGSSENPDSSENTDLVGAAPDEGSTPTPVATGPEDASEVSQGRYRVDVLRGFWTWEIETDKFASEQAATDIVRITGPVDQQTFDASLGAGIVSAADRADVVDEMLADVPLPDGFDRSALIGGFSESRYSVVADVSGAVVCAWSREWLDARDAGDSDRQQKAVDAVASARDWAMLGEIADEGAWSDSIWQIADEFPGLLDQMTRSEADEYLVSDDQC